MSNTPGSERDVVSMNDRDRAMVVSRLRTSFETSSGDAQIPQVLSRQVRKDRLVYLILAECRLILPEAQAPQPDHDVHDGAQTECCNLSSCSLERVSRRFQDGRFFGVRP